MILGEELLERTADGGDVKVADGEDAEVADDCPPQSMCQRRYDLRPKETTTSPIHLSITEALKEHSKFGAGTGLGPTWEWPR